MLGVCSAVIVISLTLWRFRRADWKVFAVSAVVPVAVMSISFLLAWVILKRNAQIAKTIMMETAIQNFPTAIAFVAISYQGPVLGEVFPPVVFRGLFPLLKLC